MSDMPLNDGRDGKGRFVPGNKGGLGQPAHRRHHLYTAMIAAETVEQVQSVFAIVRKKALEGDTAAMKIYLEYSCGKAPQPITNEDGGEVRFKVIIPGLNKGTIDNG